MTPEERRIHAYLRTVFSAQLITGPFSILVGFENGLMALNDRLKLRSMVVGEKNDTVYIASEEAAIRVIEPDLDQVWAPKGGQPVIVRLNGCSDDACSYAALRGETPPSEQVSAGASASASHQGGNA